MTLHYADPATETNVPIKSRTDAGQHILARDIERLPGTVETDIAQSRTFLETLAESVTAQRMAVDLSGTLSGYLQSLASAVTAAKLQTDVLSLPGTIAADIATLAGAIATGSMKAVLQAGTNVIGKLAANVGVNIGTVDVASVAGNVAVTLPAGDNNIGNVDVVTLPALGQLPATLGAQTSASSLSITIAADEGDIPVSFGALPAGGNAIGTVAVTSLPTLPAGTNNIGDVDVLSLPALPAGDNNIGNVDIVSLPATPTANLATIASDTTFLRSYNPSLPAGTNNIGDVDVLSLPALPAGTNLIGKAQPSDGTNHVAVKAASTAPAATDPAMVVSISPNGPTESTIVTSAVLNGTTTSVTHALNGRTTAALQLTNSSLQGSLQFHYCVDGGGQFWSGAAVNSATPRTVTTTLTNPSSGAWYFILRPGVSHVRVVVTGYVSGQVTAVLSATSSPGDFVNVGQWFDSPAPTVGQKAAASSIPVVWASDTALPAGTNNIGDVDVLSLPALPAGDNNIGNVDVASITFTDATGSGTLGALNATATVALAGKHGAGFQTASGTTLAATLTPEVSFDGGTTYNAAAFFDPATGAVAATLAVTSGNPVGRAIILPGGASHARVRVSAYTSGSATGNVRATTNRAPVAYTTPVPP